MNAEPTKGPGLLDRALAPWPLLAGAVLSFVGCCLLGRMVSQENIYQDFTRFHQFISPETLYYPTASQLRSVARSAADDDQVLVIVGGSSILYGTGQRPDHVWTRKLQDRLGPRYRVVNLAMHGCGPVAFGGVTAEALAAEHPRLIFVTGCWVNGGDCPPSIGTYGYIFWDALYKGLLPDDEEHGTWAAQLKLDRAKDPTFPELKMQMKVDGVVWSRDLWTAVAYGHLSTVWSPLVNGTLRKARCSYPDPEDAPVSSDTRSFDVRYPPSLDAEALTIVRFWTAAGEAAAQGNPCLLVRSLQAALPPSSRARTLVLINEESPYYLDRLTPEERKRYHSVFSRASEVLAEQGGFHALTVGRGWKAEDYVDRCHLSESGGAKLAEQVAPQVEALAHQLGYVP